MGSIDRVRASDALTPHRWVTTPLGATEQRNEHIGVRADTHMHDSGRHAWHMMHPMQIVH